jgi:hypothetical protein
MRAHKAACGTPVGVGAAQIGLGDQFAEHMGVLIRQPGGRERRRDKGPQARRGNPGRFIAVVGH